MKKMIQVNYAAITATGKKEKFVEHVDQIPDKVVGSQLQIDSKPYKAKRILYKLDGRQVDLVDFVNHWLDYRVWGEHKDIKFTIDYTIASINYVHAK